MYVLLIKIGLFVVTDYQKSGNSKIFNSFINEKKYLTEIPMFCLRKTGNFKGLLPVNWLTSKNQKTFHITNLLVYMIQKPLVNISYGLRVTMLTKVGFPKKAT